MNRSLILKSHYAKDTPFQFFDRRPESVSIVFFRLRFQGILDDQNTPLFLNVKSFAQDLLQNSR